MTGILYCMRYICITRDMGTELKIDLEPLLWMTLAVLRGNGHHSCNRLPTRASTMENRDLITCRGHIS
jgi:hypothetical protein